MKTGTETPTPMTDAALEQTWKSVNVPTNPIPAAFARQLERELTEAKSDLNAVREAHLAMTTKWRKAIEQRDTLAEIAEMGLTLRKPGDIWSVNPTVMDRFEQAAKEALAAVEGGKDA